MSLNSKYQIESTLTVEDVIQAAKDFQEHESFLALQKLVAKHVLNTSGRKIDPSTMTAEHVRGYIIDLAKQEEYKDRILAEGTNEDIFQAFIKMINQDAFEIMQPSAKAVAKALKTYFDAYRPSTEIVINNLSKALRILEEQLTINFHGKLSCNVDWTKAKVSFCRWAEFGWTILGRATPSFYSTIPESIEEADESARGVLDDNYANSIFTQLRNRNDQMQDIDSAVYCYKHKQYKPCCLILCALIDRALIKSPLNSEKKVGFPAAKKIDKNSRLTSREEISDFHFLTLYNTFEFLRVLFKRADDFKVQPPLINRNFLAHGMYDNVVTEIDCLKLFLGLFNTCKFIEEFELLHEDNVNSD